jgi:hypothetical protein
MNTFGKIILAVMFLLSVSGLASAIHETSPAEMQIALPGPDAGNLYEYITRHNPYKTWDLWPGKGRLYKGTEPHGALLTTFVNKPALASVGKMAGMADTSIIAKENYSPDRKFVALTVMYKIKGYNPAAGDWFWAKYDPEGKVVASGKAAPCIECHGKKKANDYIMTGKVKK